MNVQPLKNIGSKLLSFCGSFTCLLFLIWSRADAITSLTTSEPFRKIEQSFEITTDSLPQGWIDLHQLDSNVQIDIRYATADNFVHEVLYPCGRCILRAEVGYALRKVHKSIQEQGMRIKVMDCYRPRPVQQKLWEKVPDARYVTPPSRGSMHNRGAAVDLTLLDSLGNQLDMGTRYDFFGKEAYHTFQDLPADVLQRRTLLRKEMAKQGFKHIRTEWWHYSYQDESYELADFLWPCEGM